MRRSTTLSVRGQDGIRTITLVEPAKANAVSANMVEEMLQHLEQMACDGIRVLVLKGEGKNFCGGFDLSDYEKQSEGDLLHRFVRAEELLQAIRHAPFLTIACAQGAAYGAGADLVAACSYRVGTPTTRFRFPGFQFGIALGTSHLTRLVGSDYARDVLLRNQVIDGPQALAHNLLTHMVNADDFDSTISQIVEGTSRLNATALKRLLANTTIDTRDRDMAELVRSASRPGFHERIAQYRNPAFPLSAQSASTSSTEKVD